MSDDPITRLNAALEGRYRIERELGEGGMGVVYKAEDLRLNRTVALKFLVSHLVVDLRAKERFLKEARTASALDHPNICVIHEIGEAEDGELFIAMAYYGGETLAQKIERGPLLIEDAAEITRQVAQGLSKAHDRGIVHRDVKPANLKMSEDGIWKILDFGIAKLAEVTRQTRTGQAAGTVAYMAPEQMESEDVSAQSDIWSLGVVLYQMLAGRLPFRGATPVATLYQILHKEPEPLGEIRDDVPSELDRIVVRALAKDLGTRYASMDELLADLGTLRGIAPAVEAPVDSVVESEGIPKDLAVTPPPFLTPESDGSEETLLTPFVGREEEMEVLEGWLREALAGRGRVVFIAGEAGSGKTALTREFCRRAAELDADLVVASGNCDAHTGVGSPLHPFREILGELTGDVEAQWAAGSLTADHATRLWGLLPTAADALVESGPDLFGTFVPEAPLIARVEAHPGVRASSLADVKRLQQRKERGSFLLQVDLFDQYVRVLRALARERPLLLVVDDLQWADKGSVGLLFQLGRSLVGSRIILLGLYRPSEVKVGRDGERHPLEPVVNELAQSLGDVTVRVGEVGDKEFVDAVVDAEPNLLGPTFRAGLYERTRGHALFTVELLRSLQEQGMLVRDEAGRWVEGATLSQDLLPARVDAVIGERIGRLPAELQRLLTVASVEGETFTLEALAKVQGVDVRELIGPVALELEKRHQLVTAEGLRRVNGQRLSQYRFRHILFQRYLYDCQSEAERTYLHEQLGETLESLHGEQLGPIALKLARHFENAGIADKAARYLHLAGEEAKRSLAAEEALVHFEFGLEVLRTLASSSERDRQELDLTLSLGTTRLGVGQTGADEALIRALELAERLEDDERRFWALHGLYSVRGHFRGDHDQGRKDVEACLSLARKLGDEGLLVHALQAAAFNSQLRGDLHGSVARCEELLSLYERDKHWSPMNLGMDSGVVVKGLIGLPLWRLGHPDKARRQTLEAVALAQELEDPLSLHLVLWYDALVLMWSGEIGAACKQCDAAWRALEEGGQRGLLGPSLLVCQGWCDALLGRVDEGIDSIQRGLTEWGAAGNSGWGTYYTALLAQALGLAGRAEEGLDLLGETLAEGKVDADCESDVCRIRGELYLSVSDPDADAAAEAFRLAMKVARGLDARSQELLATTRLARLLREQGRPQEAREVLRDICGWFTEGDQWPYLVEAKGLLEELKVLP